VRGPYQSRQHHVQRFRGMPTRSQPNGVDTWQARHFAGLTLAMSRSANPN
jgi:hypothetical protein